MKRNIYSNTYSDKVQGFVSDNYDTLRKKILEEKNDDVFQSSLFKDTYQYCADPQFLKEEVERITKSRVDAEKRKTHKILTEEEILEINNGVKKELGYNEEDSEKLKNNINKQKNNYVINKLYRKKKDGSKYSVNELHDICFCCGVTPGEILNSNIPFLVVSLKPDDINKITEELNNKTSKFKEQNKSIELVCYSVPMLGVSCVVSFEDSLIQCKGSNFSKHKYVENYRVISTIYQDEYMKKLWGEKFGSYTQTDEAFIYCVDHVKNQLSFSGSSIINYDIIKNAVEFELEVDFLDDKQYSQHMPSRFSILGDSKREDF